MFDALYISATGMQAQQLHVDTIAHNLANVSTVGFKRGSVAFSDLIARGAGFDASLVTAAALPLGAPARGAGVAAAGVRQRFDPAPLQKTDAPLDVAIEGEGFLEVAMPDGSAAYLRGGSLRINADGLLADALGHPLQPRLHVPAQARAIAIAADGVVSARMGDDAAAVELGRLELVRFASPSGLRPQGDHLYRATAESGEAIAARPMEDGMGRLAQGFLEGSNVQLAEETVRLMVAQRIFEANASVLRASDQMLGMINALRS